MDFYLFYVLDALFLIFIRSYILLKKIYSYFHFLKCTCKNQNAGRVNRCFDKRFRKILCALNKIFESYRESFPVVIDDSHDDSYRMPRFSGERSTANDRVKTDLQKNNRKWEKRVARLHASMLSSSILFLLFPFLSSHCVIHCSSRPLRRHPISSAFSPRFEFAIVRSTN